MVRRESRRSSVSTSLNLSFLELKMPLVQNDRVSSTSHQLHHPISTRKKRTSTAGTEQHKHRSSSTESSVSYSKTKEVELAGNLRKSSIESQKPADGNSKATKTMLNGYLKTFRGAMHSVSETDIANQHHIDQAKRTGDAIKIGLAITFTVATVLTLAFVGVFTLGLPLGLLLMPIPLILQAVVATIVGAVGYGIGSLIAAAMVKASKARNPLSSEMKSAENALTAFWNKTIDNGAFKTAYALLDEFKASLPDGFRENAVIVSLDHPVQHYKYDSELRKTKTITYDETFELSLSSLENSLKDVQDGIYV